MVSRSKNTVPLPVRGTQRWHTVVAVWNYLKFHAKQQGQDILPTLSVSGSPKRVKVVIRDIASQLGYDRKSITRAITHLGYTSYLRRVAPGKGNNPITIEILTTRDYDPNNLPDPDGYAKVRAAADDARITRRKSIDIPVDMSHFSIEATDELIHRAFRHRKMLRARKQEFIGITENSIKSLSKAIEQARQDGTATREDWQKIRAMIKGIKIPVR